MSDVAKHVVIRRTGGSGSFGTYVFTVDGEPFPWHVSSDGFRLSIGGDVEMPSVTFTLLAERVEVLHALQPEPQEPE